jgi:hypothetical protein
MDRYTKPYFHTKKTTRIRLSFFVPGNVLLSQGLSSQLPSALRNLTSVFGMGTGVTFSPLLPDLFSLRFIPSKLDNQKEV